MKFLFFLFVVVTAASQMTSQMVSVLDSCDDCSARFCSNKGFDLTPGYCFDTPTGSKCSCFSSSLVNCETIRENCNQYTTCVLINRTCVTRLLETKKQKQCRKRKNRKQCKNLKCIWKNGVCFF
jgi:hypothetical protein